MTSLSVLAPRLQWLHLSMFPVVGWFVSHRIVDAHEFGWTTVSMAFVLSVKERKTLNIITIIHEEAKGRVSKAAGCPHSTCHTMW
ncbi:hypothetical protein Ae201684P_016442 [Aphanomyces euteiches]|nr:hypothetical protein Ae201684P_016442 [Aphanomyces euteiches]